MSANAATIAIAQMHVVTGQPDVNLRRAERFVIAAAKRGAQLICLPEMWLCGFNWPMNRVFAGRYDALIEQVGQLAHSHALWIAGSVPWRDEAGKTYNMLVLFDGRGRPAGRYAKTHLFGLNGESENLTPGPRLEMASTPCGPTGLSICYDLRFPELFRAYALRGAVAQLLPAAWPMTRIEHWKTLLRARAIENQFFMIAANQVGAEDFGPGGALTYGGASAILDPWGTALAEGGATEEELLIAEIDLAAAERVRQKIPVFRDRRADIFE